MPEMFTVKENIEKIKKAMTRKQFDVVLKEDAFIRIQKVIKSSLNEDHLNCCLLMMQDFEMHYGNTEMMLILRKEIREKKSQLGIFDEEV